MAYAKIQAKAAQVSALDIILQIEDWDTGSTSWYDEKDLTLVA